MRVNPLESEGELTTKDAKKIKMLVEKEREMQTAPRGRRWIELSPSLFSTAKEYLSVKCVLLRRDRANFRISHKQLRDWLGDSEAARTVNGVRAQ